MRMAFAFRFVPLALAAALLFAPGATRAQSDADGIVVYNAQHASLTEEWVKAFTKETGIKVTIRKGSDMDTANQIVQEGAASPADVFLTENSPAMALVDRAGLFAPVDKATLDLVPEEFRPGNGNWVGIAARTTVFVYDKRKLTADKLPKSMMDLASPSWKDRWAASPSGADFQAIVAAMIQLKGEQATADWLKAMKTNSKAYRGNGNAMKGVNSGEVEGAVIYQYYVFGDQAKTGENSNNVAIHYFRNQDPGAFLSLSGGGVLASSKKKPQAQAFLKWVAGKGGQDVLKNGGSFEYAVSKGAESHPKLEPIAKLQAPKVQPDKLDNKKAVDLMTAAGIL